MSEEEREQQRQETLQIVAGLRLLDDELMTAVYQDSLPCTNLTLQIILQDPNIEATKVVTQDTLKNLQGKSVRLDIHAFSSGTEYDVEIQRANKGAAPRRARYNSSIMDANSLLSGEEYEKLPENVVIFMTETDILKLHQPIYIIKRMITGLNQEFDDGTTIIYVNCADKDESTPLGKLIHDFRCTNPQDMYYKPLADRVRYFKETEEGVSQMSEAVEKLAEKWAARNEKKAEARGEERGKMESIRAIMETAGVNAEKAMQMLKIDKSQWQKYLAML